MQILIGTRNNAKVENIKNTFPEGHDVELLSLNDIENIDDEELVEGESFIKNALMKAEFYFKATGIPTLATDGILWLEKFPENNGYIVHIRKLANPDSARATDKEVILWLKNFVTKNGESDANFKTAFAYADETGTRTYVVDGTTYTLQSEQSQTFTPGNPTESLLKDKITGEFKSKQNPNIGLIYIKEFFENTFIPEVIENK